MTSIKTVICTNTEVMRWIVDDVCTCDWPGVNPNTDAHVYENNADDYTDRLIRAAITALPSDYETDCKFSNWNGGKYAEQSAIHGWHQPGTRGVVCRIEGKSVCEWSSSDHRAVSDLEKLIESRIADEAVKIERHYMSEIIQAQAAHIEELESESKEDEALKMLRQSWNTICYAAQESNGRVRRTVVDGWLYDAQKIYKFLDGTNYCIDTELMGYAE